MVKTLIMGVCLGQLMVGCSSVEPVGKMGGLQFDEDEQRLWTSVKAEEKRLDKSGALYQNTSITAYINTVAQKMISEEVKGQGLSVQIKVVKDPLLNAFAFPNGVVYVHTGILARMENEAQLATLLGHEMTHATHRHAIQEMRNTQNTSAALATLQVLSIPFGIFGAAASTLGSVGYVAAVTGYSRGREAEADTEGLELMVKAGYDPHEAPKLFEHLKKDLEERQVTEPFFFGTHPRVQERIISYSELLETRYAGKVGMKNEDQFMAQMLPLVLDNAALDLAMGRYGVAQQGVERVLRRDAANAQAHYLLGEIYRHRGEPGGTEKAEKEYRLAADYGPEFPDPHKSLGLLYLKQGNMVRAGEEWVRYLTLAPQALDRGHIEKHLQEMRSKETAPTP